MVFEFDNIVMTGSGNGHRLAIPFLGIPESGMTVIVGPSGAGKSSLLRLCNRLEVPSEGTIRFRGLPISDRTPVLDLRRSVGMVFQEPVRFAGTVLDNLREADQGLQVDGATKILARVGLDGTFLRRVADSLSGGEAQRMCIARALATNPDALLMDEPTSSLDPAATRTIEKHALNLASSGVPIVWVTHDIAQMERIATHVICMVAGTVVYEGSPVGLLASTDPAIVAFRAEQS